jgi:uncharacterized protein YukE
VNELTQRSTGDSPDGRRETPEGLVSRIDATRVVLTRPWTASSNAEYQAAMISLLPLLDECRDALAEIQQYAESLVNKDNNIAAVARAGVAKRVLELLGGAR